MYSSITLLPGCIEDVEVVGLTIDLDDLVEGVGSGWVVASGKVTKHELGGEGRFTYRVKG